VDIFDALDPGYARSRYALRATLAMFTAWLCIYFINQQLGITIFGIGIFTIIASFVCNFIMVEVKTAGRLVALGTALVSMFAALGLVSLLYQKEILILVSVVTIFFLAYYVRMYSLRFHVLGFIAVVSIYFAWVFNVNVGNLGPYFMAIIVAALSNLLFWSVLMPPRPLDAIGRAIRSYYLRSAVILSILGTDLEGKNNLVKEKKRLRQQLRRLERSKRMIEGIVLEVFENVGHPARSEEIRTTLFTTSMAIRLIASEVEDLSQQSMLLTDRPNVLVDLLREVSAWLRKGAPRGDRERLRSSLRNELASINTHLGDGKRTQAHLLHIASELNTVFENACTIKDLADEIRSAPRDQVDRGRVNKAKQKGRPLTQSTRIGNWAVPVPVLMAVQALTAGFIAISLSYSLGLVPLYQSFWFALVTVSGSLGETRLKSFSRLIGALLGTACGLLLVFVIGGSTVLLIFAILMAFFFIEFSRTISQNWFLLFLVIMLVLAMAAAGANPIKFSIILVLSSAIGVGAALLATTVLFPIRIRDKYFSVLSDYLASVRTSLQMYLASSSEKAVGIPLESQRSMEEKYKLLEQVSQANIVESNPFSSLDRDRSYEATTILDTLNDTVLKLRVDTGNDRVTDLPSPNVVTSVIDTINNNLTSLEAFLQDSKITPIMDDGEHIKSEGVGDDRNSAAASLRPPYQRDIFALLDIHDIVLVLAKSLSKRL
jgi:uncharacterized membrane protein YgaE (UPF0421/DUF939 family)